MNELSKISKLKISYHPKIKAADRIKITCPTDSAELLFDYWDKDTIQHIEQFKILLLNRANKVLGIVDLSSGGISSSVVDISLIFQYVLLANASAIILAHNHPSGNLNASSQDIEITTKIKNAASLFNITLLDHLIITADSHKSFSNEGLL